jgi:hypothetical protein
MVYGILPFEVKTKDVNNIRMRIRSENLGARSPIEAMVEQLRESRYTFSYKQNSEAEITHVFFAHFKSLTLLQEYPHILLLDCTYKVNRFKLPLLNIIGSTNINTTFFVAFCFMLQEKEEDYMWAMTQLRNILIQPGFQLPSVIVTDRELAAMNAIREVFPTVRSLLCSWHVFKCVEGKASKYYGESTEEQEAKEGFLKAWNSLVSSRSVADYAREWSRMQDAYSNKLRLLVYMKETWLDLYRYKLIHCWVDETMHFGHRVSSKVEGAYKVLKGYLQVSTGDLKFVLDNIERMLIN